MKGKWTPYIIVVNTLVVFIVLCLACASEPESYRNQYQYQAGQYQPESRRYYDLNGGTLTIHNGVPSIEGIEFANKGLTNVIIPDSVTSIGEGGILDIGKGEDAGVFSYNKLTSVTIPNSVTSIGSSAFADNKLTSVTIPNSVTSIGQEEFVNNQLTSVTIGNRVTKIEKNAFRNNRLTRVTIGNSVENIEENAFENNPLTSITIPDSINYLNGNVFTGSMRNVTRLSIGANVNLRGNSDVVWDGFYGFYSLNGNRAGTYTLSNGRWSAQYR